MTASIGMHAELTLAVGTPIHLPMMLAAEDALARSRASVAAGGEDEMREAMVAVLCAAVSVEAATHWVADRIDPAFRAQIEMRGLDVKWADVMERRDNRRPAMDTGLGEAVAALSDDRNWIAHYPGKGRPTHATPTHVDGGRSAARAHFTVELAAQSIDVATQAIAAIGEVWARAGIATVKVTAHDARVEP